MSVIYKVITRPTDPRVPNSPKRYYPHLITLGQSVNLKYIAQKMQDRSVRSWRRILMLRVWIVFVSFSKPIKSCVSPKLLPVQMRS